MEESEGEEDDSSSEESDKSDASLKSEHVIDEIKLAHNTRRKLVITVTDTGIGIKKEDQAKIF